MTQQQPEPDAKSADPRTTADLKQRLRRDYLGSYGIHGIGVKGSVIRIHAAPQSGEQQKCFEEIRQTIAPCVLEVVLEAPSTAYESDAGK